MVTELMLAAFLMAVGLAIAGAGTHLYQWLSNRQAALRYDGKTLIHTFGHLAVSFVCGPYIMLQLGWHQEKGGALSVSSALISAVVAFGWAFITGLLMVGAYLAVLG
ncbi:MAG: DUF6949 family protein [Devosia sp.]